MLAIMQHFQRLHAGDTSSTFNGSVFDRVEPSTSSFAPVVPTIHSVPTMESPMLNANRPVDDAPAFSAAAPLAAAHSQAAPSGAAPAVTNTALSPQIDWKKYLPWILLAVAVILVIMSQRKSAAT